MACGVALEALWGGTWVALGWRFSLDAAALQTHFVALELSCATLVARIVTL